MSVPWTTTQFSCIIVFLGNIIAVTIPPGCEFSNITLNCTDGGLKVYPKDTLIPPETEILDLSGNEINTVVPINSTHFRQISFQNNKISKIDDDSFDKQRFLESLDLSQNFLAGSSLVLETFEGLTHLQSLNISGNPLKYLNDNAFHHDYLKSLHTLDLSNCQLQKTSFLAFNDIKSLEKLNLSNNLFIKLEMISFTGLNSLQTLDLRRNNFVNLPANFLLPLISLRTLILDDNSIGHINARAFEGLFHLQSLSLVSNNLNTIPYAAVSALTNLRELVLNGNPIGILSPDPFKKISKTLIVLRLENMPYLQDIEVNALHGWDMLHSVYITHNRRLTKIRANTFVPLKNTLSALYLNNNNLQTLSEDVASWEDLGDVNLENNPWICDCNLKWMLSKNVIRESNHTLKCSSPAHVAGQNMLLLHPDLMWCSSPYTRAYYGIAASVVLVVICVVTVVCLIYRKRLPWRHRQKIYRAIYTHDRDTDVTRISVTNDRILLKDAVDV